MKSAASILQAVARITGPILIVLGIILWMGRGYQLLPLHIGLGVVLVVTLWVQAVLAARAGANRGFVAFAIAWGVMLPVFGMAQANLFPGQFHWVIRVLHLAVGIVAMGMIDGLGKQVRVGGSASDLHPVEAQT
jgi:hypothetical protein